MECSRVLAVLEGPGDFLEGPGGAPTDVWKVLFQQEGEQTPAEERNETKKRGGGGWGLITSQNPLFCHMS